jgi:formate dehydrogenase maturation protein FdhE
VVLTPEDLELLEGSLLPALERHYLRLLAHGLRTFQAIAASTPDLDQLPDRETLETWATHQDPLANDPAFREAFLEQLTRLLDPLQEIAARHGQSALTLELNQLVQWATEQADARLTPPVQPPG